MLTKSGERWRCTNEECKCEALVESGGQVESVNPRCACGAPMKKAYASPALSYLEFLHLQEATVHSAKD